jgi:hypothetical protein
MDELPQYYPGFNIDTHIQDMISVGKKNKAIIDRLRDSAGYKLYQIIKDHGWYIENNKTYIYLEASVVIDIEVIMKFFGDNGYDDVVRKDIPGTHYHLYITTKEGDTLYDDIVEASKAEGNTTIRDGDTTYFGN